MVKEKPIGTWFNIVTIVIEFLEMAILCFRDHFNWGGIEKFHFDFDSELIGFSAYKIIFWIITAIIVLSYALCIFVGYTVYNGEMRAVYTLKTLRWVASLFISVLFLPFLYILLSGIACDYSTSISTLLHYPLESCWRGNTITSIVGIIVVILFSILCLFAVLTYSEHDPAIKTGARLQNRYEFTVLFSKLVFIIVAIFLVKHPAAFAAVSFFISVYLFVGSLLTLPFYDHKLNVMRTGSFAGLIWVNIGMVVAMNIDDNTVVFPIIMATVGVPFAVAAGAVAADRRFKYLCNPDFVDGVVAEMETMPVQQKRKKSVNFDSGPSRNKLFKNILFDRLRFSWDVEIAARFALGNPDSSLIEKGKLVYQTGISKFPKSQSIMQGYANFMFTTVGDWQLGYVVLEKLRKMKPLIDIQFFTYRYDKDREKRSVEGNDRIGDFIDFMEYKKLQQLAKRQHATSLFCVRKFWRYLLEPKVDVMQLSLLSSKIAMAQKKADEHYTKLLKAHPKNVAVLRDYAKYLEEIALDERGASEIRRKADKYEQDQVESATASHRSNNGLLPMGSDHDSASEHSEVKSENSEGLDDDLSASSKSSGIRAKLTEAKLDKSNTLKKLGYIMLATTVFALAVAIAEIIVLDKMINTYGYALEAQNSAGGAAHLAVKITTSTCDLYDIAAQPQELRNSSYAHFEGDGTHESIAQLNIASVNRFMNILKSLFWGDRDTAAFTSTRFMELKKKYGFNPKLDASIPMKYADFDRYLPNRQEVEEFFLEPRYNESIYVVQKGMTISNIRDFKEVGLWSFCNTFTETTTIIAGLDVNNYWTMTSNQFVALAFALENSHEIASGMLDIVAFYGDKISDNLTNILTTVMIIFIVAASLLILGSIALFRPVVKKIFNDKVKTFSLFTVIPTHVVKIMSRRRIAATTHHDSSDDESSPENNHENNNNNNNDNENTTEQDSDKTIQVAPAQAEIVTTLYHPESDRKPECIVVLEKEENSINKKEEEEKLIEVEVDGAQTEARPETPLGAIKFQMSSLAKLFKKKPNYTVLEDVEDKDKDKEKEKQLENEKQKQISTKHSRLDVSSLKRVTIRLHLSYAIAIACIIVSFLISFVTIRVFLLSLVQVSKDMQDSDMRTQYIQTVTMEISILTVYPYDDPISELYYTLSRDKLNFLWEQYNVIKAKSYQMELLFDSTCFLINQDLCPSVTDPNYELMAKGYDFAVFTFYTLTSDLLKTYKESNASLGFNDPNYATVRILSDWLVDGAETLTYMVYSDAKNKIANTKENIAIITGVVCVAFVLIYLFIFRPFVKQLRAESDHTFALIRMIPRKLLQDVPEIQKFIQEALSGDDDY